ncbi:MAG: hypothetical protein GY795_51735 [Desulfobacterales bacterium]|nr:hypothetical protein [Desulfobacterales bacterium]
MRMWPTLEQPWYFANPMGIATDNSGYIYVSDTLSCQIHKYNVDGQFVTKWGSEGSGDGAFINPYGIAVDNEGYVYVTDTENHRIQKFTANGRFEIKWGSEGSANGEFDSPYDIAIDISNYVYVADTENHRIQKFTIKGLFVDKWGNFGNEEGNFKEPVGIAVDNKGFVYVADLGNLCIHKFDTDGQFISKWGIESCGNEEFSNPVSISTDGGDHIYVVVENGHCFQKYTTDGVFVDKRGSEGSGDGEFKSPHDITVDSDNYIYLTDLHNNRIQKFTTNGQFMTRWGTGNGDGEFNRPNGIVIDSHGFVYVADTYNHRIQKFDANGQFKGKWGIKGSGEKEFNFPQGIAVDSKDNIYVADMDNSRIQKFKSDGQFIEKWENDGSQDIGFVAPYVIAVDGDDYIYIADKFTNNIHKFSSDGQAVSEWKIGEKLNSPKGIAVDSKGFVYVTDSSHYIWKFTNDGEFLFKWGGGGNEDGAFDFPYGLTVETVEDRDFIYVADSQNHRIQKFDSDGTFIAKWGEFGIDPKQMNSPYALAVSSNGNIYVSDNYNHRVQVFCKATPNFNNKAIIVAGGGPYPGNKLWNTTQSCANFAYRTLTYQGFTKDTICYLTSDTDLDLDSNLKPDDVDGDATLENLLSDKIIDWADWTSTANDLIIYLVDHGGENTFRMNSTEILSASKLDSWIDSVRENITGKVIVIYDACYSGSFLSSLSDNKRIIITSASDNEKAHFITQGLISFSDFFWTEIFNGKDIKYSFESAKRAIGKATEDESADNAPEFQNPLLDSDGNGVGNETDDYTLVEGEFIGNATEAHWDKPEIKDISYETNMLYAKAEDKDGIARVWAIIIPPNSQTISDNPVLTLPSVDLMPVSEGYEASYTGFNPDTSYQVAIYANDRIGNTSNPQLITIDPSGNTLRHRAIIASGPFQSDKSGTFTETLAYNALLFQGYSKEDIDSINQAETSPLKNLENAIKQLADQDTYDLVLYMVGPGKEKSFQISETEELQIDKLDTWLDNLQNNIPGKVTVICDADYSGSYIPLLTPPKDKERIVISSTSGDQPAYNLSQGQISFSSFFWKGVLNGMNIWETFLKAKNAINSLSKTSQDKTPQLDDTGNGISNEKTDGQLSMNYTIGMGIGLADNDPIIGTVSSQEDLNGKTSATIWVKDVTAIAGTVQKVWAVITPPGIYNLPDAPNAPDLPTFLLNYGTNGRYEGTYNDFFHNFGTYQVTVYAMDTDSNISVASETSLYQPEGLDIYEDDDDFSQARFIVINDEIPQNHNFHHAADKDFVMFYGLEKKKYVIKASKQGQNCDAVIELFNSNKRSLGKRETPHGLKEVTWDEYWTCPGDDIYYLKVSQHPDSNNTGQNTAYDLEIYDRPTGPFIGYLKGIITDAVSKNTIQKARIKIGRSACALSRSDGRYLIIQEPGTFTITVEMPCYTTNETEVLISEGGITVKDFELEQVKTTPTARIDYPPPNKIIYEGEQFLFTGSVRKGNEPFKYLWDFGNGMTSSEQNPLYENFYTEGVYTIIFEVTDNDGEHSSDSVTVTVRAGDPKPAEDKCKAELSLPQNGQRNMSLPPELKIKASDPDCKHLKTRWQISPESDFSWLALDLTSSSHLTSLIIPELVLNHNTIYYWRAISFENNNSESGWADRYSFITDDSLLECDDSQPECDDTTDMNNDKIPDINQSNIKCVKTTGGKTQISVMISSNITSVELIKPFGKEPVTDTENKPKGTISLGLRFKLKVDNPDDISVVTVFYSRPVADGAIWHKYDSVYGWQNYSDYADFSSDRKSVTLKLKDGEFGDADYTKNSIIVSGLVVPVEPPRSLPTFKSPDNDIGIGGCFIADAADGLSDLKHEPLLMFDIILFFFVIVAVIRHAYQCYPHISQKPGGPG